MSGDTKNASVWADADVYVAPMGTTIPADVDTAFGAGWDTVGILDGSAGFEYSREEDKTDFYAWGGILVATSRKNHKSMYKFTAFEDNVTVRSLVWPGSTATEIKVPVVANLMIAFETTTGGKKKRMISKNYVQVDLNGSITDSEDSLTGRTFDVTVYPTDAGVLFTAQGSPAVASIVISPLTLALSLAGANVKPLTATATYSDATTGDVTDKVTWISATPAKATVDFGYVTGIATGTSSISCTFAGVTSTAPSVVTVAT